MMFYFGYKLDAYFILRSISVPRLLYTQIDIHTTAQYIQNEGWTKQTFIKYSYIKN